MPYNFHIIFAFLSFLLIFLGFFVVHNFILCRSHQISKKKMLSHIRKWEKICGIEKFPQKSWAPFYLSFSHLIRALICPWHRSLQTPSNKMYNITFIFSCHNASTYILLILLPFPVDCCAGSCRQKPFGNRRAIQESQLIGNHSRCWRTQGELAQKEGS